MSATRITATVKPTVFPCWVWVEGHGVTLWGHWIRCGVAGNYIMETYCEDSYPSYFHPDQKDPPESPYAKERAMP